MRHPTREMSGHDAIIIGGGPAGSTAATALARRGHRALVLERENFPRFHVGESLLPYNMPLFDELGVREKLEAAGFVPKYGARFYAAEGEGGCAFRFCDGRFTEHPMSYQVERARFDDLLLRHAESAGAEVREGCAVTGYEVGDGGVTVRTADGGSHEAAFLIDASGQSNFTAIREGLRRFLPRHKKVAVFGHFAGAVPPAGGDPGDIVIFRLAEAWFWMIPLGGGRTSVGLVMDASRFRGLSAQSLFDRTVARYPNMANAMAEAEPVTPLHVANDFSYTNTRLVGPRLVRVGDAAGFLDPIFSSGVFLAMRTGNAGAEVVAEALREGAALTPAMARYERETRKAMALFAKMIDAFYTRPFIDLLFHKQEHFDLPAAVNAVLAGRLALPWRVRWRLRTFFALVQLQSLVPIVPRTKLPAL